MSTTDATTDIVPKSIITTYPKKSEFYLHMDSFNAVSNQQYHLSYQLDRSQIPELIFDTSIENRDKDIIAISNDM